MALRMVFWFRFRISGLRFRVLSDGLNMGRSLPEHRKVKLKV